MMYQKERSSNPVLFITSKASRCSRRERFLNELSRVQIGQITREFTAAYIDVSTFHFASSFSARAVKSAVLPLQRCGNLASRRTVISVLLGE